MILFNMTPVNFRPQETNATSFQTTEIMDPNRPLFFVFFLLLVRWTPLHRRSQGSQLAWQLQLTSTRNPCTFVRSDFGTKSNRQISAASLRPVPPRISISSPLPAASSTVAYPIGHRRMLRAVKPCLLLYFTRCMLAQNRSLFFLFLFIVHLLLLLLHRHGFDRSST
jgi:hypothetical protein